MEKRIGVWAGIAFLFCPPIVLGIYEVMEWKMPVQLAVSLIVIATITGIVALLAMLYGIWIWSRPMRNRYGLRTPIYRRDKPNPLQWLIDIAKAQRAAPGTHLVATQRIAQRLTRDAKRPYLWVRIWYMNLSVNSLLISQAEGYASFGGEKLPELITDPGGFTNVPPGGSMCFDLQLYIPPELLAAVCKEFDSGEVRQLGLTELTAKVQFKDDAGPPVRFRLGAERMIFRAYP